MNSKQLQEAESLMKSYSDSMNTMTSIATNSTVTDSSSRTGAVLHNFSDDYRQTQDYSRQVSADEAREKVYQRHCRKQKPIVLLLMKMPTLIM